MAIPETETPKGQVVLDTPLNKTVSVLGFNVTVMGIELFTSCRLAVTIKCESLGRVYTEYREIVLVGEDYLKWSTDDSYIIKFVTAALPELI